MKANSGENLCCDDENERENTISNDFKYVYDYYTNIIHDKSCPLVSKTSDCPSKIFLNRYNIKLLRCPICEKKAFIRQGLHKNEEEFIDVYSRFFYKIKASAEEIYNFLILKNAKIYFEDKNILHVFQNEDNWKIAYCMGKITLYHNNYNVLKNGKREFAEGFHRQKIHRVWGKGIFAGIVSTICSYSWENHKGNLFAKEENTRQEDERYLKIYTLFPKENEEKISENTADFKYYVYEGVIHESGCAHVRLIPEYKKIGLNKFSEKYETCRKCLRKAVIKNGAELSKKYDLDYFVNFFNKLKTNNDDLRYLFLEHKTMAKFESTDILKITLNGETWQIKNSYGIFELWHNNYKFQNGKRVITSGFHLQFLNRKVSAYRMIREICEYSWEKNYKYIDSGFNEKNSAAQETEFEQNNRILFNCVNKNYADSFFIYSNTDEDLTEFVEKNCIVKSKIKLTNEIFIVYGKIKKENKEIFENIMERAHMLGILKGDSEYTKICREFFKECGRKKLNKKSFLKLFLRKYIFASFAVDLQTNLC